MTIHFKAVRSITAILILMIVLTIPKISTAQGGFLDPGPSRYGMAGVWGKTYDPVTDIHLEDIKYTSSTRCSLLALTDAVNYAHHRLIPGYSLRAQIEALDIIGDIPTDLAALIELKIKTHPGFPDLEIFSLANDKLKQYVLPAETELSLVLDTTNLIIAVNYFGSALINSFRKGIPVVFLWVDQLVGKTAFFDQANIYTQAGELVRSKEDLWASIRRFISDLKYAEDMKQKAISFREEYLNDGDYPEIYEIIQVVL